MAAAPIPETLYHGSWDPLDEGTALRPGFGGGAIVDTELEALFEAARPEGLVPRREAVFMAADPDEIDALGGYTEFVYEVAPGGPVTAHDLAWYSQAQAHMAVGEDAEARRCADAYWSGTAFPEAARSVFEYLGTAATVGREVDPDPRYGSGPR